VQFVDDEYVYRNIHIYAKSTKLYNDKQMIFKEEALPLECRQVT